MRAAVILCSLLCACPCHGGWPSRPWARRGFWPTPFGSIHYVYGGDFGGSQPTLAFFHMNPRSTADYEQTIDLVRERHPFVAFDYFGQGHSDDDPRYLSNNVDTDFVNATEYAAIALAILDHLGVGKFVPVGAETGTAPALLLCHAAPERAVGTVMINPIYYFPDVSARVKQYMLQSRGLPP